MVALGTLAVAAVALVAPGAGLVPGTGAGSPRWLLGPYGDGLGIGPGGYRTALWVAFAAYLVVVLCAADISNGNGTSQFRGLAPPHRHTWRAVRWAVIVAVLAFALAPPLLSLDVFSYLSYARLGVLHGLNPYDFAPAAIAHDSAAARVHDYRDATSVYGPLFTLGSYPLGLIGVPAGMWAMKALAAGSVLAMAGLVARLATARGLAPGPAAALVALNPVVLVDVVGGAHNDALMMLALVGGVALVLGAREASGGVSMVAAAAIKLPAAVAAPFALLGAGSGGRPRLLFGLVAAVAAMAAAALAVFGTSVGHGLEFLSGSQQHLSYHSLPATVGRGLGVDVDVVRAAFAGAYGVLLIWLLIWTARGGDWIRAAGWAMLGLLCATIYLVPWYVLWVLPLAAVARDRLLVILTLGLCAYQLPVGLPS